MHGYGKIDRPFSLANTLRPATRCGQSNGRALLGICGGALFRMKRMNDDLRLIADSIREVYGPLTFMVLEIGARPLEGQPEPFHDLLDLFPGSQIAAFEIDEKL